MLLIACVVVGAIILGVSPGIAPIVAAVGVLAIDRSAGPHRSSHRSPVKLYAGTTEQFRADARMHRIAEKPRAEYTTQIGHRPAPSEVASWQNSLMALSMLVDQAELSDHGVILEYQLGNTSRRLDAMLTGHSPTSAENAVVVELKQWSDGTIGPSTDNCLELSIGNRIRRVLHPSVQVGGYQQWLLDNHSVFYEADASALRVQGTLGWLVLNLDSAKLDHPPRLDR